jgi:predicted SAM-dependent methyltransferase
MSLRPKLSLSRSVMSYSKVQRAMGPIMRAFPIRKKPTTGAYLNVGAGPHARPDFFNIDYDYHPGIDLFWDLNRPLPIASNSIGGIFTEHCLEHLPLATTRQVLNEFHRIMVPGAHLRISVPDGEIYIRRYVGGQPMPFWEQETGSDSDWTQMQSVNQLFYGHGHRYIYDFPTLRRFLAEAGLSKIERGDFGSGRDPRLLIDQEARRCESLYIEATKHSKC